MTRYKPTPLEPVDDDDAIYAFPENGGLGEDPRAPSAVQSGRKEDQVSQLAPPSARLEQGEAVLLLREMRNDLARLTKISAKASRRHKAHFEYLERTKLSRRWGLALLIVIAILMVIQILQMAGYGPGGGNGDDNNTQTLQRVHINPLTFQRIHTAG